MAINLNAARPSRKQIIVSCSAAVVVIAALAFWARSGSDEAKRTPTRPPVPVSVANAVRQNVPIYLVGLGTVQASFTVGIHAQIDGKLQDVRFTEGQRVKKGDVLAKIDPRLFQAALDSARAKKSQDESMLVSYEKDLARFQSLAQTGFQTQQSIDQQQAKVDAMKASIAADEAAIQTAQTQLDYTDIVAPSDGRMGMRLVDPGNIVRASDTGSIAILVQSEPCFVVFTLPAQTLDDVRDAMRRGAVEIIAFDRDNRKPLSSGTLQSIDNVIDQATATYKLKAIFTNEDERLWPGEFVNARVLVDTQKNAIVIPNTAVQRGPDGLFTWVVRPNNTVEPRPIEVGPTSGDLTIVTSGLTDNERVVTGGQYKLQTNGAVTINAPPATPAPAAKGSS